MRQLVFIICFLSVCTQLSAESVVEEVVVQAEQQAQNNELGLSSIELSGDELTTKLGATLGDTLANELGVHNASYGPGVGLPVLRGLSGVRIRLSEDGIGAWDASSISPDHASAIEPVLAESIQVIKGPATALHGNNAVGGTVEVRYDRIAEQLNGQAFKSVIEARKELVNDHESESYVGKLKAELGRVVMQVDGFSRQSNDMSIPGVAIQEDAIADIFGIGNSDNTFGTVLNTDSESQSGSLALSYVGDKFFIGASSTSLNSEYGIPPGAHTEPADSPGHSHSHPVGDNIVIQSRVRINLEQERHLIKLGGDLEIDGLENYRISMGSIEYQHREFEINPQTGELSKGTLFENEVFELKAELEHSLLQFINTEHSGRVGVQWVDREFSAKSQAALGGGEDFVPPSDQQAIGVFIYEQFPFSVGSIEIGGRYERQKITQRQLTIPLLPNNTQFFHEPISYQTYTLSTALTVDLSNTHSLILNLNSVQRAPEIQELLSLGPHLATRSYDIGLLIFERQAGEGPPKPERFYGIETRWEWRGQLGDMTTSLFYTDVEDFIFQQKRELNGLFDISDNLFRNACVRLEECIAVFDYTQSDATLAGYEYQWLLPSFKIYNGEFQVELFADYVRGKLSDGGDLPRMPPRRQGMGLQWNNGDINAELRYHYVSAQNRPGDSEAATKAYELLNANIAYTHHFGGSRHQDIMLFLQMKNLLDEDIRKSTSFLRNFTPEPGREISLGMRYRF